MNILISCDENYLRPLRVMLVSLFENTKNKYNIYLIHKNISDKKIEKLEDFVENISDNKSKLISIKVDALFMGAKTTFYYTEEMYYRLLAYKYLPENLGKILYLDPDILVLNSFEKLYNINFKDNLFAAATHSAPAVQGANVTRLSLSSGYDDISNYFNSGILMINLNLARESENYEREVKKYIEESKSFGLLMPDQDLLNVVFRNNIISISELEYNYDARKFLFYKLKNKGWDLSYVMDNTKFLHFCGKRKPWFDEEYIGIFASLYKYFLTKADRIYKNIENK
ncbi:glycosyltransferase family 8 protein [Anaerococcus sp. AGMB00486]|uniref:Glycosyltransferase family 8 protein n=1 Tax=Anaerococcus faecalis TaxID=2742993 RepID=A0ABX2NBH2_9FIRM|nr:glycosyltransferase family 8 protein [Anaerococcus faecalis]NVF12051.1 glycosyltransferase family 8 protein [Anaerococcus faecalis]